MTKPKYPEMDNFYDMLPIPTIKCADDIEEHQATVLRRAIGTALFDWLKTEVESKR